MNSFESGNSDLSLEFFRHVFEVPVIFVDEILIDVPPAFCCLPDKEGYHDLSEARSVRGLPIDQPDRVSVRPVSLVTYRNIYSIDDVSFQFGSVQVFGGNIEAGENGPEDC